MIPSYTRYDLSMNVSGSKYYLPFENSLTPEEAFAKTVQLFSESSIYERKLYTDRHQKSSVSHEQNEIQIKCSYQGYDECYPFTILVEVFRLNDENNKGAYMIAMRNEHEYQGLLDELLDIKVVPKLVSALNLNSYS